MKMRKMTGMMMRPNFIMTMLLPFPEVGAARPENICISLFFLST